MVKLFLGCHQLSFSGPKDENLSKILDVLTDSNADLDIFPEYAMGIPLKGLTRRYVQRNAEPLKGEFVTKIVEKTLQKQSSVVFTTFLKEGDVYYNAAILAEGGKIRSIYRKIHLFDAFGYEESKLFTPGRELAITTFRGFNVGLAVCFDIRFPELFRSMAYRGVNLFIVPSGWYKGKNKLEQWRFLIMARAHENASYLVAVDQILPFFIGHSMVASPLGYRIQEVGDEQASFKVELNKEEIDKAEKVVPIIKLSKPRLYREFDENIQRGI